jgi:hypothetical protein
VEHDGYKPAWHVCAAAAAAAARNAASRVGAVEEAIQGNVVEQLMIELVPAIVAIRERRMTGRSLSLIC